MAEADTYCPICGIQTSRIIFEKNEILGFYNNDIVYLLDVIEKKEFDMNYKTKKGFSKKKKEKLNPKLLENYKKFVNDLKKLKLISKLKWNNQKYLITDDKVIKNLKNYELNDYSTYFYNKKTKKNYSILKYMWTDSYYDDHKRALLVHKSCFDLLKKKFKYELKIEDIKNKLNSLSFLSNHGKLNKFIDLQFEWVNLILNLNKYTCIKKLVMNKKKLKINYDNINFLSDPLKNKKNADRIIKLWTPIIKKIKEKSKKNITKKKLKKSRPSPAESATLFKVGKKKKGNDGNFYIVIETKNKVKRWKKL